MFPMDESFSGARYLFVAEFLAKIQVTGRFGGFQVAVGSQVF